jgi:hypothetical protein
MTSAHHPLFPAVGIRTLGRELSVVANSTGEAWCSLVQEENKHADVRVVHRHACGSSRTWAIPGSGQCQSVNLIGLHDGRVRLIWNAVRDGHWGIYTMSDLCGGEASGCPVLVHRSEGFCLGPAAASDGYTTVLCWPEERNGRIRIMLSMGEGPVWKSPVPISPPDADAFRPAVCAHDGKFALAWDEYRDRTYGVRVSFWDGAATTAERYLARAHENWFAPRILVHSCRVYVAWVASQKVQDTRGVVDHACYGLVGQVTDAGAELLQDGTDTPSQAVADLREGLLAIDRHYNYDGLRRNPRLVQGVGEHIWCIWERLPIRVGKVHAGELVGREYDPASRQWGTATLLHEGSCGYAVSSISPGRLCVAHLCGEVALDDVKLGTDTLAPARMLPPSSWRRWSPRSRFRVWRTDDTVNTGNETLGLYWVDTHCHGNFSPDAEGEMDELIHYARDVARLDGVCIADNDYYPAKALTPAEWQLNQNVASHYTNSGRFVVFAGYEYTFWGVEGINHRILLYPPGRAGALHRRIDPGSATVSELLRCLASESPPPVCYAHHTTYDLQADPLDQLVEVCSSWRVCMAESDFTRQQLAAGKRFGFIGSSDTHRAVPGMGGALTGVYASDLVPEDLLAGLRLRRTIATQGFRIFVDFRAGGAFIGGETAPDGTAALSAIIRAPRTIERVDILRDGDVISRRRPATREVKFGYEDVQASPGRHAYVLQIKLRGTAGHNVPPSRNSSQTFACDGRYPHNLAKREGCYAWTSPIWVTVV